MNKYIYIHICTTVNTYLSFPIVRSAQKKNITTTKRTTMQKKQIIIASNVKACWKQIYHISYTILKTHRRDFLGVLFCAADETHHPAPRRPPVGHPSLSRSAHGSQWRRPSKDLLSEWYMGVSKNSGTPKWMVYNGKPY